MALGRAGSDWLDCGLMRIENARLLIGPEVLPSGYSHMSGPYLIEIGDRCRLFFTSRHRDGDDKVISSPFFLDLDKHDLKPIGVVTPIQLGFPGLGSYREHGVFPFSVYPFGGHGALMALATGWQRRLDVDVETAVGVFFSLDHGLTWAQNSCGPRFSASRREPFLVCDASYLDLGQEKVLAYAFGVDWAADDLGVPQRRYLIGANSAVSFHELQNGDGVAVIPTKVEEEVQAYPNLLSVGVDTILMAFCWRKRFGFREDSDKGYKLGFAEKNTSGSWVRADVLSVDFPVGSAKMQCYPSFFSSGDGIRLLFNGDEFGRTGVFVADIAEISD